MGRKRTCKVGWCVSPSIDDERQMCGYHFSQFYGHVPDLSGGKIVCKFCGTPLKEKDLRKPWLCRAHEAESIRSGRVADAT